MPSQDLLTLSSQRGYSQGDQLSGLFLEGELPVLQPGNSQAHCPVLIHMLVRMHF